MSNKMQPSIRKDRPADNTKIGRVLDHLNSVGSLSNLEAIHLYQDFRLSGTVEQLRNRYGYVINSVARRDNNGRPYTRYTMVG